MVVLSASLLPPKVSKLKAKQNCAPERERSEKLTVHGSLLTTDNHIKPSYQTKPALPGLKPGQLKTLTVIFLCIEAVQNSPERKATTQGIVTDNKPVQCMKAKRRLSQGMCL